MTPWGLKYAHRLGHNGPGKVMAPCGQRQKVSDTSISSSLSLGCLKSFEATRVWSLNTRNTIPFHLKKPYWVDKELQGRRYVAVYVVLGGKTEPVILARPTVSLKLQCSMPVFERPSNLRRDYLFFSRQPLPKMHLDFDISHLTDLHIIYWSQLSNLWLKPNSVSKGFGPEMRKG